MATKCLNVRKSVYELTLQEKEAYVQAVLKLKHTPSPISGRTWDTYVRWHQESFFYNPIPNSEERFPWYVSYAHGCSSFLPWHRKFLRLLEEDLQAVSGIPAMTIPYWDWGKDQAALAANPRMRPEELPIWHAGFMGGNGSRNENWRVQYGPFSYKQGRWPLKIRTPFDFDPTEPTDSFVVSEPDEDLRRQFGGGYIDRVLQLPTTDRVREVLDVTPYDAAPWNYRFYAFDELKDKGFRNILEVALHNGAHMWVGWSMGPWTSPNDPSFFLHHSNVERIWTKWQDLHPDEKYLPEEPIPGFPGQSVDEVMKPFDVTIRSVLNYRDLGYQYDGKASDDEPIDAGEQMASPPTGIQKIKGNKSFTVT